MLLRHTVRRPLWHQLAPAAVTIATTLASSLTTVSLASWVATSVATTGARSYRQTIVSRPVGDNSIHTLLPEVGSIDSVSWMAS